MKTNLTDLTPTMADLISSFLMFDRPAGSGDAKTVRKRIAKRVEPADAAARDAVQRELANVLSCSRYGLRAGITIVS